MRPIFDKTRAPIIPADVHISTSATKQPVKAGRVSCLLDSGFSGSAIIKSSDSLKRALEEANVTTLPPTIVHVQADSSTELETVGRIPQLYLDMKGHRLLLRDVHVINNLSSDFILGSDAFLEYGIEITAYRDTRTFEVTFGNATKCDSCASGDARSCDAGVACRPKPADKQADLVLQVSSRPNNQQSADASAPQSVQAVTASGSAAGISTNKAADEPASESSEEAGPTSQPVTVRVRTTKEVKVPSRGSTFVPCECYFTYADGSPVPKGKYEMSSMAQLFEPDILHLATTKMVAYDTLVRPQKKDDKAPAFYVEVCCASHRQVCMKANTTLGTLEKIADVRQISRKGSRYAKTKAFVRLLAEITKRQTKVEERSPVNEVAATLKESSANGVKHVDQASGPVTEALAAATAAAQASQPAASASNVASPEQTKAAEAEEDRKKLHTFIDTISFKLDKDLTKEKADSFRALLHRYADKGVFALRSKTPEACKGDPFRIELLPGTRPIRQKLRRFSPEEQFLISENVRDWLESGFIRPSRSPWSANIVLVEKKDGSTRVCCDYRGLNASTIKQATPLPLLEDLLCIFGGKKFHSALDLAAAFQQILMDEASAPLTAFACHLGVYEWLRLPFGLSNGPAHMQGLLEHVLFGLSPERFGRFIDDIRISSTTIDEHIQDLVEVFERLLKAGLQLKITKCSLLQRSISYLGHLIDEHGIRADPAKLAAIKDMRAPTDKMELLAVLGTFNYYRRFIIRYSLVAGPLTKLLKKSLQFSWGSEQEAAFKQLKHLLCEEPIVLHHPLPGGVWRVYTDGSRAGIGASLVQAVQDPDQPAGKLLEHVLSYDSRKLRPSESNYGASELEALAVVFAVERYRPYLQGRHFELYSDHEALRSVFKGKNCTNARIARWAMALQAMDFQVLYRPGCKNHVDALSRLPVEEAPPEFDFVKRRQDKWHLLWEHELPPPAVPVPGIPHDSVLTICESASHAARELVNTLLSSVEKHVNMVQTRSHTKVPQSNNQQREDPAAATDHRQEAATRTDPLASAPANEKQHAGSAGKHRASPNNEVGTSVSSPPLVTNEATMQERQQGPSSSLLQPTQEQEQGPSSLLQPNELNFESIKAAQSADPFSCAMLRFLRGNGTEADHEELRCYDKSMYTIHDGALLVNLAAMPGNKRRVELAKEDLAPTMVLYLPPSCRAAALHVCHDDGMSGHFSFAKTSERLKDRFHWHGLAADTENYCKSCLTCAQHKSVNHPIKYPLGSLPYIGRLFGRAHVDLQGPIEPPTARGNRWILVVHCASSKWAEAIALPNKEAGTVAKALLDEVFTRYSFPDQLMSDQGSEFRNRVLQSINELLQIHQSHSSPYHPAGNGQAEVFNKTLASVLKKIVKERVADWDLYLPICLLAYRTMMHEVIGMSPFVAVFKEQPRFPLDIVLQHSTAHLDSIAKETQGRLELVKRLLRNAYDEAERRKQRENAKLRKPVDDIYKVGDQVLLRIESANRHSDEMPNKFRAKYSGPWTVQAVFNNGLNLTIKRDSPMQTKTVHASKVKLLPERDAALRLARENELIVTDFTPGEILLIKGEKSASGRSAYDDQLWLAKCLGMDGQQVKVQWYEGVPELRVVRGQRVQRCVPTGQFVLREKEELNIDPATVLLVFDGLGTDGRIPEEILLAARQVYDTNGLNWPRLQ